MATNTPLQSVLLTSSTSTVTFSNIDQSYTDLVLVVSAKVDSGFDIWMRCNGDTGTNYSFTVLTGDGSTISSTRSSNVSEGLLADWYGTPTSSFGHILIFNLNNYSNTTTYKTSLARSSRAGSGTDLVLSTWRNTAAITSLTLRASNANRTFDAGSTFDLYGIKSGAQKAFGGDVVATDGTYWYHAFRNSGTFTPQSSFSVDYLVVAGGGGGGNGASSGGGGGAGGYRTSTGYSTTGGTGYTVTIGAGGVGSANDGTQGSNSVFATITSTGGGYGGRGGNNGLTSGGAGGSGGGAGGSGGSGAGSGFAGGAASPAGQGNAGGSGASGGTYYGAGGGGGAGAVGANAVTVTAGNGGAGLNTLSNWLSATGTGASGYVAGGGGGGTNEVNTGYGTGGAGGGGRAGYWNGSSVLSPVAGTANTGGGGGGGGSNNVNGASGGSGLVIVRYAV